MPIETGKTVDGGCRGCGGCCTSAGVSSSSKYSTNIHTINCYYCMKNIAEDEVKIPPFGARLFPRLSQSVFLPIPILSWPPLQAGTLWSQIHSSKLPDNGCQYANMHVFFSAYCLTFNCLPGRQDLKCLWGKLLTNRRDFDSFSIRTRHFKIYSNKQTRSHKIKPNLLHERDKSKRFYVLRIITRWKRMQIDR